MIMALRHFLDQHPEARAGVEHDAQYANQERRRFLRLSTWIWTIPEHNVMVWGEPHIVAVYRKSETVYEAIGNYMCETICVNDKSEGAAIKRWRSSSRLVRVEQLTRTAG